MVFCLLNPCQRARAPRLFLLKPASHNAERKGFHLFPRASYPCSAYTLEIFRNKPNPNTEEESKGSWDVKNEKSKGFQDINKRFCFKSAEFREFFPLCRVGFASPFPHPNPRAQPSWRQLTTEQTPRLTQTSEMVFIWGFAPMQTKTNLLGFFAKPGWCRESHFEASKVLFMLGRLHYRTNPVSFLSWAHLAMASEVYAGSLNGQMSSQQNSTFADKAAFIIWLLLA